MNVTIADAVALGALLAALAGYLFNAWVDRKTRAGVQRTEAYLDFVRSQLALAVLGDSNDPEVQRMDHLNLDARARLLLYGSAQVVEALGKLKSMPRSMANVETLRAFSLLFSAMRKDSVGQLLQSEDVARILVFGQGESIPADVRNALK